MAGVGVGLTFGPLAIHARFSQPSERVAIVVALNLFVSIQLPNPFASSRMKSFSPTQSRSLGGTVGLAQCSTILNAKVHSYFANLPATALSANGVPAAALSTASLSSLQDINQLPPAVQALVRNAFRNGVRWSFISLIPWCALSLIGVLFLSKIKDTDRPVVRSAANEVEEEKPGQGEGGVDSNSSVERV